MNSIFLIVLVIVGSSQRLVAGHDQDGQAEPSDWDIDEDIESELRVREQECSPESIELIAESWRSLNPEDSMDLADEIRRNAGEKIEFCIEGLRVLGRHPSLKYYRDRIRPKILAAHYRSKKNQDPMMEISVDELIDGAIDYLLSDKQLKLKDYKKTLFRNPAGKSFRKMSQLLNMKVVAEYNSRFGEEKFEKIAKQILQLLDSMKLTPTNQVREELIDYQIGSVLGAYTKQDYYTSTSIRKPVAGERAVPFDKFAQDVFKELKRRANDDPSARQQPNAANHELVSAVAFRN